MVAIAECASHPIFEAIVGAHTTSEFELAKQLTAKLEPGMVLLADRGFYGFPLWELASASGADLAWRMKAKEGIRMRRPLSRCLIGPVLMALALAACTSQSGSVQGYVVRYGPVAPMGTTTTTLPLARSTSTVEAKSGGKTAAVQKVPPGGQFHFSLPPGDYQLSVVEDPLCSGHVSITSGQSVRANVVCVDV